MKQHNIAVVIGRMEPPHIGHIRTIQKALDVAENVIVVLGSHDSPRTIKNPFLTKERESMILDSLPNDKNRIFCVGIEDTIYSDTDWYVSVTNSILNKSKDLYKDKENVDIALVAYQKDESGYYLNYFKQFKRIEMDEITVSDGMPLSSTKIRELYFEGFLEFIKPVVSESIYSFLKQFYTTEEYLKLKNEYNDAVKYQKMYENIPYGYTNFLTVDSVVIQSGHILLIKRAKAPGKDLWALPGGHLSVNETFLDGALRELKEETQLKVPEKVLRGSIFYSKIFDHPDRSLRCRVKGKHGRSVTMAFGFKLNDEEKLPKVKGDDDASDAKWIPINEVYKMRNELFEDHFDIIKYIVDKL